MTILPGTSLGEMKALRLLPLKQSGCSTWLSVGMRGASFLQQSEPTESTQELFQSYSAHIVSGRTDPQHPVPFALVAPTYRNVMMMAALRITGFLRKFRRGQARRWRTLASCATMMLGFVYWR